MTGGAELTEAETREIVTPYAFRVHDSLIGLPLARPWRRATAISIDGVLTALLSLFSPAVLLLSASLSLWIVSRKSAVARRRWLRVAAVLLALTGILGILASSDRVWHAVTMTTHVIRVGEFRGDVERGECRDAQCARQRLGDMAWLVAHEASDDVDAKSRFDEYLAGLTLSPQDREQLWISFQNHLQAFEPNTTGDAPTAETDEQGSDSPAYSVLGWARGLLRDLGLSLGWAALYFSMFTVIWKGQTPGKRLLHIRVRMLGGGQLTWWDAFSRYGGYGAGFATGLLGFVQLTWDANRQAIQDKITGTVVTYEKRKRPAAAQ